MSEAETQAPVAMIGQLELVNAAGPRAAQVEAMLAKHGIVIIYPADAPKEKPENPIETPVEEPAAEGADAPGNSGNAPGRQREPDGSDSVEGGDGVDGVV